MKIYEIYRKCELFYQIPYGSVESAELKNERNAVIMYSESN